MNKKTLILTITLCSVLIAGVFGITYAYFVSSSNNGTSTPSSVSTGSVELVFNDKTSESGTLTTHSVNPNNLNVVRHFETTNDGAPAYVNILFKDLVNTYLDGSLIYTLKSGVVDGTYTETLVSNEKVPVSTLASNKELIESLLIPTGSTYYELTISYDYKNDVDQSADLSAIFNTGFTIELGEEPYEQLINYQFIYDGSLGDTTLNQMSDITGGWTRHLPNPDTGYYSGGSSFLNLDNNSMYSPLPSTQYPTIYTRITNNAIPVENLTTLGFVISDSLLETQYWSINYAFHYTLENNAGTSRNPFVAGCSVSGPYSISGNNKQMITCSSTFDSTEFSWKTAPYVYNGSYYFTARIMNNSNGGTNSYGHINELFYAMADDFNALASKIGVTVSSIDALLNNYSSQLLNDRNAVKYMLKQCTGDFMIAAIQNSTFKTAYESSPYKSMIDANEHWHKFITMIS